MVSAAFCAAHWMARGVCSCICSVDGKVEGLVGWAGRLMRRVGSGLVGKGRWMDGIKR